MATGGRLPTFRIEDGSADVSDGVTHKADAALTAGHIAVDLETRGCSMVSAAGRSPSHAPAAAVTDCHRRIRRHMADWSTFADP